MRKSKLYKLILGAGLVSLLLVGCNSKFSFDSIKRKVNDYDFYNITYNLNGGKNNKENPKVYTSKDEVIFKDPSKIETNFLGWYDSNGEKITKINKGSKGAVTINASWDEGNKYYITLHTNGGTVPNPLIQIIYGKSYSLPVPERKGYTFDGWYLNDEAFPNTGLYQFHEGITLEAHYTIITYHINYDTDGGSNNHENPNTYTVESDDIVLKDAYKQGCDFLNWVDVDNDDAVITTIPKGSTRDYNIKAIYNENRYYLTVSSMDASMGTVEIVDEQEYYHYGDYITVKAYPNTTYYDYKFDGWWDDEYHRCGLYAQYQFQMPDHDVDLVARFATQDEIDQRDINNGKKAVYSPTTNMFTYGLYPKTVIKDQTLLAALGKYASLIDTGNNRDGIYKMNDDYYCYVFTNHPTSTFDDGGAIGSGKYWFKCEAITWKVLSKDGSELLLYSKDVIDCDMFNTAQSDKTIEGEKIHANNYYHASGRSSVNNHTYKLMFMPLGIQDNNYVIESTFNNDSTTVMNSTNPYVYDREMNDKVFLLSYKDLSTIEYGFNSPAEYSSDRRVATATDYAKARGCDGTNNGGAYYWTRSPGYYQNNYASYIDKTGTIKDILVADYHVGLRVAMRVNGYDCTGYINN